MSDIFDYSASPLNPALKLVITMLFFLVMITYYETSLKYGEEVQDFITALLGFAVFITMASLFRYVGHGIDFGFNEDLSLKWFQSLWLTMASLFYILAGKTLVGLLRKNGNDRIM